MNGIETAPAESIGRSGRDLDWRFLLPAPRSGQYGDLLVIGGTVGLPERIAALGIARSVSDTSVGGHEVDAVVVLNGAPVALPRLARRVRPGGVVYFEGHRTSDPELSTPRRVARILGREGLRCVQSWAVRPGFTEKRAYLPLDVPGSFTWYLSVLRSSRTAGARLLELASRGVLAAAGPHATGFPPCFAVTAVAPPFEHPEISVLGEPSVSAILGAGEFRPLLVTYGGDRVVLMPFLPGDRSPLAVIKIPRAPQFNGRTANDSRTLAALHRCHAGLRSTVPEPLGLVWCGDVNVSLERFRQGTPMQHGIHQWGRPLRRKIDDLRAAGRWLLELHRETEVNRSSWGEREIGRWIDEPLQAFTRAFGLTGSEALLFERTRSYARVLRGASFPTVCQHRDFKPSHVFRSNGALAVIDWEGARPGPPLCDLLHFVLHWHGGVRGVDGPESLVRLLRPGEPHDVIATGVSATLREYLGGVRLDRRFVPVLLLYTCVELALRRADQQHLQGDTRTAPRAGNSELALVDVLANRAREIFADDPRHALAG